MTEETTVENTFRGFLESAPPSHKRKVLGIWRTVRIGTSFNTRVRLETPGILLDCDNAICGGVRTFRSTDDVTLEASKENSVFVNYLCSNCRVTKKSFCLSVKCDEAAGTGIGECYKYGEMPEFGPSTPARLTKMVGVDSPLFFKGRQCEIHGQGIGAFSYYRRVVENQKNRILETVRTAAEKLSAPQDQIAQLSAAIDEIQFSKAMESVKDAMPPTLLVNGKNPITLLHIALSRGMHAESDEECLEAASDVRLVLAALSERLAQALNDEKQLKDAVERLSNPVKKKKKIKPSKNTEAESDSDQRATGGEE